MKHLRRKLLSHKTAMTITEIVVAMAILAILFSAVLPQFRNINNSWDIKKAAAETIQNERILIDHINRTLAKANLILAMSDSGQDMGFIEFRDDFGNTLRYQVSESNYVQFIDSSGTYDIAGPVQFFRITGYKLDPFEQTDESEQVRFITVETAVTNSQGLAYPPTTISSFVQTNGQDPPQETKLIGYWPLDENDIGVVEDHSYLRNDGLHRDFGDNTSRVHRPGKVGKAVEFEYGYPNSLQAIEIPHIPEYELRSGTISFWFKPKSFTFYREELFSKDAQGYLDGGHITIWHQFQMVHVRFQSRNNSYYICSGAIFPFWNQWNHVAFTFGDSGMRLYIDGVLHSGWPYTGGMDSSSGGSGNQEPIALGQNTWTSQSGSIEPYSHSGSEGGFNGFIDEVSLFNQALSAEEINKLYHFGTGIIEQTEIILP